ncbi:MAG: glucosylceramidase, partial [Bacteroidota bacterium]|nr:glucosylceramidase [Bacteroidota bacterium]
MKAQTKTEIQEWLTSPDKSSLFAKQEKDLQFGTDAGDYPVIKVDDKTTYQSMVGFGFALTGGSATPILQMDNESRSKLLHELFATEGNSIGVSYIRLSIGASDLNDFVFSYDDLPMGETDVD